MPHSMMPMRPPGHYRTDTMNGYTDLSKVELRVEDTGLDVEIILTIGDGGERKKFDKGDGILFLGEEMKQIDLSVGHTLVCGDTGSDCPMLAAVVARAGFDRERGFVF